MKKLLMAGVATFSILANADGPGPMNDKAVVRDVSASNPGMEVIIPYKSVNAAKSTVSIRFDVYPVGSATKLYSTIAKTFTLSSLACNTKFGPINVSKNDETFTAGAINGGVRQIDALIINRWCWNSNGNYIQRSDSLVYGADVSMAGAATWSKQFPDTYVGLVQLVNSDTDASYELMLGMSTPGKELTSVRMMFLNPLTGAAEISAKDRVESSSGFTESNN